MSKIRVLIVEDMEQVAKGIETQLASFLPHDHEILQSRNVNQALQHIESTGKAPIDLILCDYNLGENTNGQQLLEYLRFGRFIPRRTAFIMLTGESAYSSVATAVELAPDAYLLKPYTVNTLYERIDFAFKKRDALKPAYTPLDLPEPDFATAISACNALILQADRFTLEALRLKAECLLRQEKWGEAATVYDKILAWRPLPWAEVGRARALRHAGHAEIALDKLKTTIKEHPQFVAAYDELAELSCERGDRKLAQYILEKAHAVVPSNRRTRQLGLLALENGDIENAAKHLRVVTDKDRYGLLRSTEDFFGLAHSLRQLNRHDEAMQALATLSDHFPPSRPLQIRKQAAEAMVQMAAGASAQAQKTLDKALASCNNHTEPRTQMELAEACQHCGRGTEAMALFKHVAQNWHESPETQRHLRLAVERSGLGIDGLEEIERTSRELIALNNRAATLLQSNHVQEVIEIMETVAEQLTHNSTVQSNYIHALLYWVEHNAPPNLMQLREDSKPRRYLEAAKTHLRKLAQVDPRHHKLPQYQTRFARLTGEVKAGSDQKAFPEELASMQIHG